MTDRHAERLIGAGRRAADWEGYMGHLLERYRRREGLTEGELRDLLRATPSAYARLALCRVPDAGGLEFGSRIGAIAAYAGMPAVPLASIVRQEAVLEGLSGVHRGGAPPRGFLLAARERDDDGEQSDRERPEGDTDEPAG